ncbi:uncharacterized protein Bfra_012422 [Botrytis fragariae]|uniref:Uncharacterized protein n=1 Tax=Botrytis fragariae TaxID=1964551 RepID=A0A8H6AJN0_9HELO|nr:uncharacterized protein Bfra_012422 [Botrytis fragariae]KAF5868510.1 hypothetical protein Bfra_012422 [Botrytis fragariae]
MNNNIAYPEIDPASQRTIEDLAASMREDEAFAEYTNDRETEVQMYIEERRAHLQIFIEERQIYRQMYIEERETRLEKERKEARFTQSMTHTTIASIFTFIVFFIFKYCL